MCEHLRQIEGCPSVQIKEMPRVYNAEKRVGEEEERGPEAGEESREGGEGSEGQGMGLMRTGRARMSSMMDRRMWIRGTKAR